MAKTTDQSSADLTPEDRRHIDELCRRHEFPLADAEVDGDILRLTPASIEDLPAADALGRLADRLDDEGYRYVTFAVPNSWADGAST